MNTAILFTSPTHVTQRVGDDRDEGFARGSQASPAVGVYDASAIKTASHQVQDALSQGGYSTLANGRALTGTVTTSAASPTVTGVGTKFLSELTGLDTWRIGSVFNLVDEARAVLSIADDVTLTLAEPFSVSLVDGTALTINGDAAVVERIIWATTALVLKFGLLGNNGMLEGREEAIQDAEDWLDKVRAGRVEFRNFDGSTIASQDVFGVVIPDRTDELLHFQLDNFEAVAGGLGATRRLGLL